MLFNMCSDLSEKLVDQLVEKLVIELQNEGRYIPEEEIKLLKGSLKQDMSIETSVVAYKTLKKVEYWDDYTLLEPGLFENLEVVEI